MLISNLRLYSFPYCSQVDKAIALLFQSCFNMTIYKAWLFNNVVARLSELAPCSQRHIGCGIQSRELKPIFLIITDHCILFHTLVVRQNKTSALGGMKEGHQKEDKKKVSA